VKAAQISSVRFTVFVISSARNIPLSAPFEQKKNKNIVGPFLDVDAFAGTDFFPAETAYFLLR
jgi:hypothetical protein